MPKKLKQESISSETAEERSDEGPPQAGGEGSEGIAPFLLERAVQSGALGRTRFPFAATINGVPYTVYPDRLEQHG